MEEKKTNNTKKGILIGCGISALLLTSFLGSYAYFMGALGSNKNEEVNVQTGTLALTFSDGNNAITEMLEFGGSVEKTFSIENTGTLPVTARIMWDDLVNTYLNGSLTYSLSSSDTEDGAYENIVENKNVPVTAISSKELLADDLPIPVSSTIYYKLTISLNYLELTDQTADLNAILSTHFSVEESVAPEKNTFVKTLLAKANPSSITEYDVGNKTEMYTFSHDATAQTPVLTDYRYIGSGANNYVNFNNETWKIVGVFSVQSEENGEYEQRVKITRSELMDALPWDTKGNYEWASSSLFQNLNQNYYMSSSPFVSTGLDDTARSLIAPAKWYLGGSYLNNDPKTLYGEERYSGVIANVGLIYASDFYYTYINDGTWLKEDNAIEVSIYPQTPLLDKDNIFIIDDTTAPYNFRPTVYLRADVEIASGTGAQDDMYELKPIE